MGFGQRLTHAMASSMDFKSPEPEAGDKLFRFREGAVDHRSVRP